MHFILLFFIGIDIQLTLSFCVTFISVIQNIIEMFNNTEQQFCKLFIFMHLVDALIQSNLHYIQAIIFIINLCVP